MSGEQDQKMLQAKLELPSPHKTIMLKLQPFSLSL